MRKSRWLMIALLLVAASALGMRLGRDWKQFRAQNDPQALKLRSVAAPSMPTASPARDYSNVAQQNPFHPERNDSVPQPEVARAAGPPPLIYGSMILGKERFALMATEGNPKPQKVVEGDSFNGYKLAEVRAQSVILESDGGKNEVMFYNALSRLRRDYTKTQAAVAPTAPATAVAGSPAVAQTTTVSEAPRPSSSAEPNRPTEAAPPGKRPMQTPFGIIWLDK